MAANDRRVSAEADLWISRLFDAPRELVFEAWTDPVHLARWSGPGGFTVTHSAIEIRPGGVYRSCLRAPDGVERWVSGVYREIVKPSRLVFTHAWEEPVGSPLRETLVTVTFVEEGRKTRMTLHQTSFATAASRDGHQRGWLGSFERLEAYLATATEVMGCS